MRQELALPRDEADLRRRGRTETKTRVKHTDKGYSHNARPTLARDRTRVKHTDKGYSHKARPTLARDRTRVKHACTHGSSHANSPGQDGTRTLSLYDVLLHGQQAYEFATGAYVPTSEHAVSTQACPMEVGGEIG